jgi:hypothetical protein
MPSGPDRSTFVTATADPSKVRLSRWDTMRARLATRGSAVDFPPVSQLKGDRGEASGCMPGGDLSARRSACHRRTHARAGLYGLEQPGVTSDRCLLQASRRHSRSVLQRLLHSERARAGDSCVGAICSLGSLILMTLRAATYVNHCSPRGGCVIYKSQRAPFSPTAGMVLPTDGPDGRRPLPRPRAPTSKVQGPTWVWSPA